MAWQITVASLRLWSAHSLFKTGTPGMFVPRTSMQGMSSTSHTAQ